MLNSAFPGSAIKPAYKCVQLSPRHAKAISLLLAEARSNLAEDKKHWLKPKSAGEIGGHFAAYNPAFGVMHDQQLIACCLLRNLSDAGDETNRENYPVDELKDGNWAVQSVAVHPAFKNQGLMKLVVDHATAYAKSNPSFMNLIAKVNAENTPSQKGFLRKGFALVCPGQDFSSGDPVVYLGLHTGSGLARQPGSTLQSGYDEPAAPQRR